jgi:undecaprenyl diphosphate synthase
MSRLPEQEYIKKIKSAGPPRHIAIIMDGNGRWAKKRKLPRISGHRAAIRAVRAAVEGCRKLGVEVLTLYAFSTENWKRPRSEVGLLMKLLHHYLRTELKELKKNNIRLAAIGDLSVLPEDIRKELEHAGSDTSGNDGMLLNLALNYGARQEIVNAAKKLCAEGADAGSIDEASFARCLYTSGLPDPDLLIRTSGELRISNFLLWQLAYTELYFTGVLWPDFTRVNLYEAVMDYQARERRYGGL